MLCITLLAGGIETTANHINMSLVTLLTHPGEWERLRADPSQIPVALSELLPFVQLATGVPLHRIAREDLTLGCVDIKAGEVVLPLVNVADRDPRAFAQPDRLDLARNPVHLAFGAGVHRCLGAHLATVELHEALRGLLSQLDCGSRFPSPSSDTSRTW